MGSTKGLEMWFGLSWVLEAGKLGSVLIQHPFASTSLGLLPEWWNVYKGASDLHLHFRMTKRGKGAAFEMRIRQKWCPSFGIIL